MLITAGPSRWLDRLSAPSPLERLRAQIVSALAVGWGPFVLLGGFELLIGGQPESLLLDLSVHARLVVALPLLLLACVALDHQSDAMLERLAAEGFVAERDRPRFARLVRHHWQLRSASSAQLTILALSLLGGWATLAGWLRPTGILHGVTATHLGPARAWFGAVAQPLFLFVLGRTLWRWAGYAWTIFGLARLPLQLQPGHPDRRGGLDFLSLPSLAFHAPFLLAAACVFCASWGTQVMFAGAHLRQFEGPLVALLALGEAMAFGPLLVFTPRLFLAAKSGRREYGGLATDYVRDFRRRWMAPARRDDLLGTPDLQALNDLGGAYRESVESMSPLVFRLRDVLALLVLMLLPMIPLVLSEVPVQSILKKLAALLMNTR